MKLLANIFGSMVGARNQLYDRRLLRTDRLASPVISVGNLSVGGSGKTPFVVLLGEILKKRAIRFAVLSRGYGRKTRGVAVVNPAGRATDFGDEPLLIARRLQVPVVVGESRYQAGLRAEKEFAPQLYLLDDGFQHRQLARDFDIVLLSPEDAADHLLPSGRLREPFSSLRRADVVVLSDAANESLATGQPIWRVQRSILVAGIPSRPIVFCGIARPEKFVSQLRQQGVEPAEERFFPDHHPYSRADVQELQSLRAAKGAGGFITTEKDAINLGDQVSALQPLTIVPVTMELQDADNAVDTMLRIIAERRQGT